MIGWMSTRAKTERRQRAEHFLAYAILGLTLAIMLLVVGKTFNATGYLSAWDAGGHLLKADYFAHNLLTQGNLTGWFPTWHGGFDLFQFYPPLLYYILGPLTLVFEPEFALRLVTAGLWFALVPVTYYFLRSFEAIREHGRPVAAIGTSFLLALNASFGIGLGALYGVGLLPNGLGAVIAIWLLGRLKRDLSDLSRGPAQLLATGGLFGLLILAHTFSAYWWGLVSLGLVLSVLPYGSSKLQRVHRRAILKRYALIIAIGVLLSAYWWIPLILSLSAIGTTGVIQQAPKSEIFASLIFAKDSGGIVMALLAAGGLFTLAARRSLRTFWFFVGASVLSLLLSLNIINGLLPFGSVVGSSQFIRFQAFFAFLMMVLAVFGLVGIWQILKRVGATKTTNLAGNAGYAPHLVLGSLTALLFVAVLYPTLQVKQGFVKVFNNPQTAELNKVSEYLRANLKTGDFVITEFNWESRLLYGSPHFVNQRLPMQVPNLWDLDGNFPEGTAGAASPVQTASTLYDPDILDSQREYMASRGLRYIITSTPTNRPNLASLPWLTPVYAGKTLGIYEVTDYQHRFGLPPSVAAKLRDVRFDAPVRYTLAFASPVTLERGTTVALSHHPWLKAMADGRPIATSEDAEHRLVLNAATQNVNRLEIRYDPPALTIAAGVVSFVTAITLVIGVLLRRRLAGWLKNRSTSRSHLTANPGRRSRQTNPRR